MLQLVPTNAQRLAIQAVAEGTSHLWLLVADERLSKMFDVYLCRDR